MVLTKIRKALTFHQSPKKYIDLHTNQRINTNEIFNLMNNSKFGKTLENLHNRRKIDLVSFRAPKTLRGQNDLFEASSLGNSHPLRVDMKNMVWKPMFDIL